MCCSTSRAHGGHGRVTRVPCMSYTPVYCDKLSRRRLTGQKKRYAGRNRTAKGELPAVGSNQEFSAILEETNPNVSKVRHKGRHRQVVLTHAFGDMYEMSR